MIIQNPNRNAEPGQLRDPSIITYDGKYYMVATSPAFWEGYTPGVKLWSSEDLKTWQFERVIISANEIPENCGCKNRFWAPELFVHRGRIYCTVSGRNDAIEKTMHVYLAIADRITGPYHLLPEPVSDWPWIDASLFEDDDGQVYITAAQGSIYLAKMDLNSGKVCSEPQIIASPGQPGEWDHGNEFGEFIEGNYLIKRNGVYYLWYSGVGRSYEMGWFTAKDIQGPFTRYGDGPILSGLGTRLHIAGHNCCFQTLDGRDAVAFHGHKNWSEPESLCIDLVEYPMKPRKISLEIEI